MTVLTELAKENRDLELKLETANAQIDALVVSKATVSCELNDVKIAFKFSLGIVVILVIMLFLFIRNDSIHRDRIDSLEAHRDSTAKNTIQFYDDEVYDQLIDSLYMDTLNYKLQ